MSATGYVKNKWVDILINGAISALIILFGFWLSSADMDAREISKKIDQKADKTYVDEEIDKAISDYEKIDAARYDGISDMFKMIREEQAEMRHDIKEILKNQK